MLRGGLLTVFWGEGGGVAVGGEREGGELRRSLESTERKERYVWLIVSDILVVVGAYMTM